MPRYCNDLGPRPAWTRVEEKIYLISISNFFKKSSSDVEDRG